MWLNGPELVHHTTETTALGTCQEDTEAIRAKLS